MPATAAKVESRERIGRGKEKNSRHKRTNLRSIRVTLSNFLRSTSTTKAKPNAIKNY